jgi:hypothetical protein
MELWGLSARIESVLQAYDASKWAGAKNCAILKEETAEGKQQ